MVISPHLDFLLKDSTIKDSLYVSFTTSLNDLLSNLIEKKRNNFYNNTFSLVSRTSVPTPPLS